MGHLTNSSLQNGIKSTLWCIPVARHHLFLYLLIETVHFVSQWEDVAETKGGYTVGEQFVSVYKGTQADRDTDISTESHVMTLIKAVYMPLVNKNVKNWLDLYEFPEKNRGYFIP